MFALIRTACGEIPGEALGGGIYLSKVSAEGMNILCLHLMQFSRKGKIKRQIFRAVKVLQTYRITTLLFEKAFPFKENFLHLGFKQVDTEILYWSLLPQICDTVCAMGAGQIYIYTEYITREVEDVLRRIKGHCRYILTDARWSETVLRALQMQYGFSVIQQPGEARRWSAEAAFFFSPPDKMLCFSPHCYIVGLRRHLNGVQGGRYVYGAKLDADIQRVIEMGFSEQEILSALLQCGRLRQDTCRIREIYCASELDKVGFTLYN